MGSPTIEIVPFRREHYERAVGLTSLSGMTSARAGLLYERGGPAFTGLVDGEVGGCAGVVLFWPGVGEAWAVLTETGREHPVQATELVRTGLRTVIDGMRLRRVQADVSADFLPGHRWIRLLGFSYEGTMPRYGPNGEDFVRYVMFPETTP